MTDIIDLTKFRKTGIIDVIQDCKSGYYIAIKKDNSYKIDSTCFMFIWEAGEYLDSLENPLENHVIVYVDKQGYITEKEHENSL